MKLMNLQRKLLWPQVYNELKECEKKIQVQNIYSHETYDQNYI